MRSISSQADDNPADLLDAGHLLLQKPPVADTDRNHTMTNHTYQTSQTQRSAWQAPLLSGLVGVAVGAAIGAGTGMW